MRPLGDGKAPDSDAQGQVHRYEPLPPKPSVSFLFRLGTPLVLVILTATACSLLIDLEPDCDEVSDCTPYVCNSENTACLDSCTRHDECAAGYLCQRNGATCVSQGCSPAAEPAQLFSISGSGLEYDVDIFNGSFWVLYSTTEEVALAEIAADGSVVGGETGWTVLAEDPLASPVRPMVVPSQEGAHLFWLDALDDVRLAIRHYAISPEGVGFGPVNGYEGAAGQNIDLPSACRIGDHLALAWTTLLQRSQIQLLLLNLDGTYGESSLPTAPSTAAVVISDEATGSSQPALAATATRGGYARRETRAGVSTIEVSFFNSEFEAISSHQVSGDEVSSGENIVAAGMDSAIAVAWIEVKEGQRTIMRAIDAELSPVRLAWNSNDYTTNPKEVSIAAAQDEFALVWVGEAEGRRDIFFSRYSSNGELMFVTFPITRGQAIDPRSPIVVSTDDGYAVFWLDDADESRAVFYQRYSCTR